MHTFEIPEIKYRGLFASEISELNPDQYIEFVRLLLAYMSGIINHHDFRIHLLLKLANIKITRKYRGFSRKQSDQKLFIDENIHRLADCIDSFFTAENRDGQDVKVLNLAFTKNLIPKINKLYGPDDALMNCSFCEFRSAYDHFSEFCSFKNVDALNKLIAVLYRPRKSFLFIRKRLNSFDGQIRIPFTSKSNPVQFDKRLKLIEKLPYHVKYAVFLWFRACEEFIRTGQITISGQPVSFSILYKSSEDSKSSGPSLGWIGVLYSLAENKTIGNMGDTDNANLYDVLVLLYKNKMDFEDLKRKTENDSNKSL